MEIQKIGKLHNLKIWIESFDLHWKYTIYPNERCTSHIGKSLFFLIGSPIRRLIWKARLFINSKRTHKKEQCEVCGDGWATWMIDEPNGEKYSIVCCDGCVDFYDWKLTRRGLEK